MIKVLSKFPNQNNKNDEKNKTAIINHYLVDSYGEFVLENGHRVSIPRKLRKKWLIDEKEYIEEHNTPILIVCGEFSSTDTAAQALEMGYNVKVVCGAHILDEAARDRVIALKEKYGDKFVIYKYSKGDKQKPLYHSVRIGRNLFFENEHDTDPKDPEDTSYDTAEIIVNANSASLKKYDKEVFKKYEDASEKVECEQDIRNMPTLVNNNTNNTESNDSE